MDSLQYIHGFSELKTEFRTRQKTKKLSGDLALWFSVHDGVLLVHDFENHKDYFILGIHNPRSKSWKIYVEFGSFQYRLTKEIIGSVSIDKLADEFNQKFKIYGYWRPKIP